jgi:hypothetical protein
MRVLNGVAHIDPELSIRYLLTGIAIAYLYLVSRSPYLPIGFIVALISAGDISNSVVHTMPSLQAQASMEISIFTVPPT